jgi:hypothetical protein
MPLRVERVPQSIVDATPAPRTGTRFSGSLSSLTWLPNGFDR